MTTGRRACMALLLWFVSTGVAHGASRVALVDALATLHGQGYDIVYSNDLVSSSMFIDVDVVDFDHVQAALPPLGLKFVPSGNIWLVVREAAPQHERTGAKTTNTKTGAPADRIETLIVTGSRQLVSSGLSGASTTTVTAGEMNVTPALAGDAMRVANRLPGMSSVGVSAKPLVRGGVQDETLILLDGIELLDPFHLADFQSIFSSVDDRTVDAIDVYTGGFPARYGNRMSGVMEISTIAPDAPPRTELGLSLFSAFANTRGVSADGDTSWLASARRGNLELLVNWLDKGYGSPKYDDAYFRIGERLSSDATVYAGVFVSRDDITLKDNDQVGTSDIDTTYWWTRLDATHGESLHSSTILTYVLSDRDKSERSQDPDLSQGFLDYKQTTHEYVLRSDFTYTGADVLMEFGLDAKYGSTHYDATALIDRGPIATLFGNPAIDTFDIHTDPSGWSGGAYWSGEFWLGDSFAVQPGVRWDFQDYYGNGLDTDVSPRLGLRYMPTDDTTVRLTVGRYFQPEAIQEMKVTDGVDHYFAPQRADHLILGVDWDSQYWIKLRAEAYYKRYDPTRTRYENVFNTFVLLPELDPDRVAVTPSRARVEGVDLQARFEFSPDLSGVLRGSYMNADDKIEGRWVPRTWSQHYTGQAMLTWQRESYSATAAYTWNSGWRTTQMPASVPIGTVLPLGLILNNGTLSDFESLDFSFSKTWHVGRATVTARSDLVNVLDHDNTGGIGYTATETATDILLKAKSENLLPMIPSVGIIISF